VTSKDDNYSSTWCQTRREQTFFNFMVNGTWTPWSGGEILYFCSLKRFFMIGDGVNHVSLNISFDWNFLNLCKPRQCLGLIMYWLCSVLLLVSQAWRGTLNPHFEQPRPELSIWTSQTVSTINSFVSSQRLYYCHPNYHIRCFRSAILSTCPGGNALIVSYQTADTTLVSGVKVDTTVSTCIEFW
jgi:hypothetical protein